MENAASLEKMKKDELAELCKKHGITGYSKMKKDDMIAALTAGGAAPKAKAAAKAPIKEKAPAKSAAKAPAKEKASAKSAAKAPAKEKAPAKSAAKAPAKEKAPAKSAAKAPAKEKAPSKTAAKAPAKKSAAKASGSTADLALYCTALTNLWGIAPTQIIAAVYNQYQNAAVTAADVAAATALTEQDGALIHASLAGKTDEIASIRQKQEICPFYIPYADHIADFADDSFREKTHEFSAMHDFMVRAFKLSDKDAHANTVKILNYLNDQSEINTLMAELAKSGIKFADDQQFRNFAVLLDKLKSSARFFTFSGHTAAEAANFAPKSGPIRVFKVGRNDPCPCGSGKKYKKCCGR